ncbi:LamG domain-containing protein [Streptomyces sp. HUAS ZL42]|uniref:LamG domain-containing protein n=1 Tax=Streptomyces sp. HUAS ZL42 TaxID=3231715 RepID=UPI00345ED6CF
MRINRWVDVAVTYGDGIAVLYVDGSEAGRNASVTVEPRYFGNHPYLKAAVDDFRVYGRALTPSEVAALARPASG